MQKMTNWEELEWRGLVKDVAGADIQEKINNESVTFWCVYNHNKVEVKH